MKNFDIFRNKDQIENQLYFFLVSFIPLAMLFGPAISLINTIIIGTTLLIFSFSKKIFYFKKIEIILLLILYFYLIFNSLISIDKSIGINRNLGFVRFILFFIAINYLFYLTKNHKKIFNFWLFILSIFLFDIYFERFYGSNILGFGKIEIDGVLQPNGDRVVSFFKDEPIAGSFLSGYMFILLGFIFSKLDKNNFSKFLSFLILTIFLVGVLITGERSNTIKVFVGCLIFLFIIDYIKLRTKFLIVFLLIATFSIIVSYSDYIKMRYAGQIYNQLVDKETRSKFSNNLYIQLYKSGYAVFKNNPLLGVGNKNYRVETCDKKKRILTKNIIAQLTHTSFILNYYQSTEYLVF